MSNYSRFEGKLCPVCLKRFTESDDIVVCPVCGTPHHRECYAAGGACALEKLHGSFSWDGSLPEEYENSQNAEAVSREEMEKQTTIRALEAAMDTYVKKHGSPNDDNCAEGDLSDSEIDIHVKRELDELLGFSFEEESGVAPFPYYSNMVRMLADPKPGKDGVSMRELTFFTGISILHYATPFQRILRGEKKRGFNLSSGVLMPIHQFFRKMDGLAFALLLLTGLVEAAPFILFTIDVTDVKTTEYLMIGGRVLLTVLMLLMCCYGDYIYYRYAVKRIRKVRERFEGKTDSVEYYLELKNVGGTSTLRAVVGMLALAFITVLVHVVLFPVL